MSSHLSKRTLGRILFGLACGLPWLRPQLRRWGLRTTQAWFEGETPEAVSRQSGHRLKLASFSENYLSFELFWRGLDYYEPLTTALAEKLTESTRLFIDAGANIGFYSLRLAVARPELEIVSFEPHPRLNALLAANVRANGFRHITTEAIALSNHEGAMPFYLNRSDMSSSLEPGFDSNHAGVVTVNVSSLDAYLARRGGVPAGFLMKVDVEGHEPAFFEGAEETLRRHHPDIIAEAAVPYPERTVALLQRCGYNFWQITDEGLLRCDAPAAYLRESLVFLNCLLTTRPAAELAELSAHLKTHAKTIDLRQTSKRADPRVLDRCRTVFAAPVPPPPVRSLAGLPGRWPNPQTR
jgi:FkbM family methyltransferase